MLKLPTKVNKFLATFKDKRFKIYLVGGAVRELLLGHEVDNWDFATDATPEQILKLYPKSYYNNKYGTVTIIQDSVLFEVTTFRSERDYSDFRHPEKLTWAKTIEEDLKRRDFTINSMAYDGKELIDPYGGKTHLQEKLIVAVGNPDKRFSEDALRLLRAIRFASELGFMIEEKTKASLQKNCQLILNISWERIRDELLKILSSDNPAEGILFMKNTGLLALILPEVDICFMIPQKSPKRHHVYDVGTHLVMSLKNCPSKDVLIRLAALLHDIGKAETYRREQKTGLITFYNHEVVGTRLAEKIVDRLRLSNKQKEKVVRLVKHHQFTVTELQTDKAVRRFIRQVGKEYLQDMLDLRTADRIGSGAKPTSWRLDLFKKRLIDVQKEPFTIKDLKISGDDVMKILKLKPGPKVGEILKTIFNDVEQGKLKNERNILLKALTTLY